jgi:hypothetical protein
MACPWNLDVTDEPDEGTHTITCVCRECGRYADLDCHRDFTSGALIVSAMTCKDKGGWLATREMREVSGG